jgi:hypothetical protein
MPLINISTQMLSDLVFHEIDPSVGYARRVVNVTIAAPATIPLGRVVFRTIASGALDQNAPYAPLTTPGTQLVATNEFAVVFGDKFSYNPLVTADADGTTACVSYVRDEVQLKDDLLLSANGITRGSANHLALKALLEKQGIIIETTLGA